MKKQTLALVAVLLAACLLAGCGGASNASNKETFTIVDVALEDLDYQFEAGLDGVVINAYTGSAEAIRIPAQLDDEPVVQINGIGNSELKHIELPDSVTKIAERAFSGCESLQTITIPDSVTVIENNAFSDCESLQEITLPPSIVAIGKEAFSHCKGLQSITLPESIALIPPRAFYCCSALESVTLPNSIVFIDDSAFAGCTALTSVTIPVGVQYLGRSAFKGCTALEDMELPDTVSIIANGAFEQSYTLIVTYRGNSYNRTNFEEIYTQEIVLQPLGKILHYMRLLCEDKGTPYYENDLEYIEYYVPKIRESLPNPEDRDALDAIVAAFLDHTP